MKCEICGVDPCQTPGFCRFSREADAAKIDWLDLCVKTEGKHPVPLAITANALCALNHDPKLVRKFAFDEMLRRPMILQSEPRPVTDDDTIDVQVYLQRNGLKRISRETTFDAICNYSLDHPYHPLRDAIDILDNDGRQLLANWPSRYLGVAETSYSNTVGRKFLISMMARLYEPGCKADHMLILEGPQGTLKSTACRVLAGKYFSDNLPDLSLGKECSIHIAGKWLIEVSELHAFSRVDANHLKSFLSREVERYRPVYARSDIDEPRTCVMVGTSNKEAYLRDETGGRRFWPLKCGMIDVERLRTDRDQLLAEARDAYRLGESWWADEAFEREFIQPEQEKRYEVDEWDGPIGDHIDNHLFTPTISLPQLAKEALGLDAARLDMMAQKRIAAILTRRGWSRFARSGKRGWEKITH
jgi:predicted P-loop ATPase